MGYESKIKNRAADDLFDAIMSIEDLDECYKFFSDPVSYTHLDVYKRQGYREILCEDDAGYFCSDRRRFRRTAVSL